MIEAYSEQLITLDELRAKMPQLRAREASLRGQLDALDAQAADRDAYLKLAGDLEGFLARLRGSAATASTEDRRRVLRLLVKDVLIGPEKITIRHRIPVRERAASGGGHHDTTDTEGDMRDGYQLCWGRGYGSFWRLSVLGGEQDSFAEQREVGSPVHLPFDHFHVVDAAFDGPGVPAGGQALGDGVEVLFEALGDDMPGRSAARTAPRQARAKRTTAHRDGLGTPANRRLAGGQHRADRIGYRQ